MHHDIDRLSQNLRSAMQSGDLQNLERFANHVDNLPSLPATHLPLPDWGWGGHPTSETGAILMFLLEKFQGHQTVSSPALKVSLLMRTIMELSCSKTSNIATDSFLKSLAMHALQNPADFNHASGAILLQALLFDQTKKKENLEKSGALPLLYKASGAVVPFDLALTEYKELLQNDYPYIEFIALCTLVYGATALQPMWDMLIEKNMGCPNLLYAGTKDDNSFYQFALRASAHERLDFYARLDIDWHQDYMSDAFYKHLLVLTKTK